MPEANVYVGGERVVRKRVQTWQSDARSELQQKPQHDSGEPRDWLDTLRFALKSGGGYILGGAILQWSNFPVSDKPRAQKPRSR